jgi:hypothetical protein
MQSRDFLPADLRVSASALAQRLTRFTGMFHSVRLGIEDSE